MTMIFFSHFFRSWDHIMDHFSQPPLVEGAAHVGDALAKGKDEGVELGNSDGEEVKSRASSISRAR
jgi:hypothetical protein